MRLFFALWPPAQAARSLWQWAGEAEKLTGGRRTAEGNIHLTLAFLGEADAGKAAAAARRVVCSSHQLPMEQARYWRENSIVWAGPRETPPPLKALVERLGLELFRGEFMLERRPFAAHVTLIRKARKAPLPPLPALEWPVREFSLVRSTASSAGARYEVLERFALGFTLIEMLIVLGVVAILALMMIPSFVDGTIRSQVAEALPLADIAQKPVGAAWTLAKTLPADNAAAGLPPKEKIVSNLVSGLAVEGGAIHLTFGNRANSRIRGKVLTLRPAVVEDAPVVPVAWVCGFAPVPEKMTAKGVNKTDIPPGYLPMRCR
jgi:type IV pilus assembly protein PilA